MHCFSKFLSVTYSGFQLYSENVLKFLVCCFSRIQELETQVCAIVLKANYVQSN